MRAVHRFEEELLAFHRRIDWLERILAVFVVVSGSLVQLHVPDMRAHHLHISGLALHLLQELLQLFAHGCAVRQPDRQASPHLRRESEKLHFLANLAMVAFLGLFQELQILLEVFLLGEGNPVNTGQHLAILIPAPISPGNRSQLERLDKRGIRDMRPAAQIGERAVGIKGNRTIGQIVNQIQLVLVPLFGKVLDSLGFADILADKSLLLGSQLHHPFLDFREIVRRNLIVAEIDIVIETGVDMRPDTELGTGIQLLDGFCRQVSCGMPECSTAILILPSKQGKMAILINGAGGVPYFFVHFCSQYIASQAFAQTLGHFKSRNPFGVLLHRPIR